MELNEFFEWRDAETQKLVEFYKPVFDGFEQLEHDNLGAEEICVNVAIMKDKFMTILERDAERRMERLPGYEEANRRDTMRFLAQSGAMESASRYHEYQQPNGMKRVVQYDEYGDVVFEQFVRG